MKSINTFIAVFLSAILLLPCLTTGLAAELEPEFTNPALTWEGRAFGQSTDLNFDSQVVNNPEKIGINEARVAPAEAYGTIGEHPGDVTITMESRGGKITGGHDGIAYYYTRLDPHTTHFELAANIKLIDWGKYGDTSSISQHGFGIMVRDTIGPARQDPFDPAFQEIPAASNMLFIGANSGSRTNATVRAVYRRGVVDAGNLIGVSTQSQNLSGVTSVQANGNSVRMAIGRDDAGFYVRLQQSDGSLGNKVYHNNWPVNLMQQQDPDNLYVGFFASRSAQIEVTNIEMTVSEYEEPETLPTLWVPTNSAVKPTLYIRSGTTSTTAAYKLTLYGNEDGTVQVTQNGEPVGSVTIQNEVPANLEVTLVPGTNSFSASYTNVQASANTNVTYNVTEFATDVVYASPTGTASAAGTLEEPTNVSTAISRVAQGGTVYLLEGTYSGGLSLGTSVAGALDARKTIRPVEGAHVHFENGALSAGTYFWHIYGLEFSGRSSSANGSFNIIELCEFHDGNETGLSLGNGSTNGFPFAWPSYNLVKNCTSHGNIDGQHQNADGFAPKLGVGPGNVFDGCIAYNNVDDGYDLYNKVEKGANAPITIINCIAYNNGIWVNPQDPTDIVIGGGGGNGFKVGGEGIPVGHIVENCLSFNNRMAGFSDNFNPGPLSITNNTAFNNQQQNFIFRNNPSITPSGTYRNNLSFRSEANPNWVDSITGDYDETNYLYDGTDCTNGTDTVTAADFVSIEVPEAFERDEEGNILYGDFLRLAPDSALATAGVDGTFVGALEPAEEEEKNTPVIPVDVRVPEETTTGTPTDTGVTTETVVTEGEAVTETTAQPAATVTEDTATSVVSADMGKEIVNQAQAQESTAVVIAPKNVENVSKVEVTVPASTVTDLSEKTDADVTVKTPVGDVTLSNAALAELEGDVTVSVEAKDGASNVVIAVDGEPAEEIPGGVKVAIPVEEGQIVVIVDEEGNQTVVPKSVVEDGVAYAVLEGSATIQVVDVDTGYGDVDEDDWFYGAVSFTTAHALFEGVGDNLFAPEGTMTRAMVATVLWRLENKAAPGEAIDFPDVQEGQWYTEAVAWASSNGILIGDDTGAFNPDKPVTREELAIMFARYANLLGMDVSKEADLSVFADGAEVDPWAVNEMKWAVATGLIRGTETNHLLPRSSATRAQVSTILERFVTLIVK